MSESKPEPSDLARRVTADDREAAVKRLTAAFASDVLPVDEFERRVAEVYAVETARALSEITRDLPDSAPETSSVPATVDGPTAVARPPAQRISSLFSSIERRVQGPPPELLDVQAVMGSVELDLRRAEFPAGVTEIRVMSIMGSIEVELPDDVRVENDVQAFLGNFSVDARSRRQGDGPASVVRITGYSILASVEVELDD